jgi:hypothetical protein
MVGGAVGEIVRSRNPKYSVGDIVLGYGGWQEYAISNGTGLRKLDPTAAPVSTALGVLGMPGLTAFVGLLEIGQPKPEPGAATFAIRMQYRGEERTTELPLTQNMIGQHAFEAAFRNVSMGELIGEIIVTLLKRDLLQTVLECK